MSNKENEDDYNFDEEAEDFSVRGSNYFPAQTLGEGSYGAVRLVYDDDSNNFAMKEFEKESEDVEIDADDSEDDEPEEENIEYESMDLGTLREISVLRMFSRLTADEKNEGHPGIMPLHDICKYKGQMTMVMPKMCTTLTGAVKGKALSRKQKLTCAHKLLAALAFLHKNNVIHRDLKCDNILMDDDMNPVLADFSLAKIVAGNCLREATHTGGLGTACYKAPEVYKDQPYGLAADVYSMGVCLLEMYNGMLAVDRDKAALKIVSDIREKLSDKPIPALLKALLHPDPAQRPTCEEALKLECFSKFPFPTINKVLGDKLSAQDCKLASEDKSKKAKKKAGKKEKKNGKKSNKRTKQDKGEKQLVSLLEIENELTVTAAKMFHKASAEPLENCLILAAKMYENELPGMSWIEDTLEDFDNDFYADSELKIFKAMDWCLFV